MDILAGFVWLVSVMVIGVGLLLFVGSIFTKELDLTIFGVCVALVVVGLIFCVGSSKVYDHYYVAKNESTLVKNDKQDYDIIKIVYNKGIPDSVVYVDEEGKEYTKTLTDSNTVHSDGENNYFCISDNEYKNNHNVIAKEHIEKVYLNTMDFYKYKYHTDNVDIAIIEKSKTVSEN